MSRKIVVAGLILIATASLAWAAPTRGALFRFFRQLYLFSVVNSTGESYKVSPRAAGIDLGALEGPLLNGVRIAKNGDLVRLTRSRTRGYSLGGKDRLHMHRASSFELAGRAVHVSGRIDRMHLRDAEGFCWSDGQFTLEVTRAVLTAERDGSTEAVIHLSRSAIAAELWRKLRAGELTYATWLVWQGKLSSWSPQVSYTIPGAPRRAGALPAAARGVVNSLP